MGQLFCNCGINAADVLCPHPMKCGFPSRTGEPEMLDPDVAAAVRAGAARASEEMNETLLSGPPGAGKDSFVQRWSATGFLRHQLVGWTDIDVAHWLLGCSLGLFTFDDGYDSFRRHKHIFWATNPLGIQLNEILDGLVHCGVIHVDSEDELRVRYNSAYTPGTDAPLLDTNLSRTQVFRRVEEEMVRRVTLNGRVSESEIREVRKVGDYAWENYYTHLLALRRRVVPGEDRTWVAGSTR